jgi:very-short-patch-repair endonuclease
MSHLPSTAIVVIHRQLGYITRRQLTGLGVSARQRLGLESDAVLERVGRSVYRVPGMPQSLESRAIELSLEHPDGFVTGAAAGVLLGLRKMPSTFQIEFCVPHGARFDASAHVRVRQSTMVLPEHVRELPTGIRIATYDRLAFDLAASLSPRALSSVVEQMLQRGDVSIEALFEMAALMWSPRRPGSETFNKMLIRRHGGAAAESDPELLVLQGLLERNVPVRPQQHLVLDEGQRIRIDMAVPEARWAVEVDVHPSHHDIEGATSDKRRDRQLHKIDWQVERVTAIDLSNLGATLDELNDLYRRRLQSVRR